jgi:hypothetical protein
LTGHRLSIGPTGCRTSAYATHSASYALAGTQKVHLVDSVEHVGIATLDDLVLQRGDAEPVANLAGEDGITRFSRMKVAYMLR